MKDLEAIATARRDQLASFVDWYENSPIGRNWKDLAAETRIRLHEIEKLLEAAKPDVAQEIADARSHKDEHAAGLSDCATCGWSAEQVPA